MSTSLYIVNHLKDCRRTKEGGEKVKGVGEGKKEEEKGGIGGE